VCISAVLLFSYVDRLRRTRFTRRYQHELLEPRYFIVIDLFQFLCLNKLNQADHIYCYFYSSLSSFPPLRFMATELSHYSYDVIPSCEMSDNILFSLVIIYHRLKQCYWSYDLLPFAISTHDMPPALPHAAGTRVEVVMASSRWLSAYRPSQDLPV
jgi:hypothetical protein